MELSPLERDILTEIATIGGNHAVGPMSKVIGEHIIMTVPLLEITTLESAPNRMGISEEVMTVVVVRIEGDASGTILLVLKPQDARQLVGSIAPGMEISALEEIGNILSGTALGALGTFLHLTLRQSVPSSATDMLRALVNEITAALGTQTDRILLLGVHFTTVSSHISGQLYFLFEPASTQKILAASHTAQGALISGDDSK